MNSGAWKVAWAYSGLFIAETKQTIAHPAIKLDGFDDHQPVQWQPSAFPEECLPCKLPYILLSQASSASHTLPPAGDQGTKNPRTHTKFTECMQRTAPDVGPSKFVPAWYLKTGAGTGAGPSSARQQGLGK